MSRRINYLVTMTSKNIDSISWRTLASDDEFHRIKFAYGAHNDRYIIVAGGYGGWKNQELSSAVVYDSFSDTNTPLPDLPRSGGYHGVVLKGYFYVFEFFSRVYRLCLVKQSKWELVTRLKFSITHVASNCNLFFLITNQSILIYRDDFIFKVKSDFPEQRSYFD